MINKKDKYFTEICPLCKKTKRTKEEYDSCLGYLPGVTAACCGHGKRGYIYFNNGRLISFDKMSGTKLVKTCKFYGET